MSELAQILVTGGGGQIGRELARLTWGDNVRLHVPTRDQLDISDLGSVRAAFRDVKFKAVINAGAFTAVDQAERNAAAAFNANALGPAVLAELTSELDIPLIQVSTDYVFDGLTEQPYLEIDRTNPLSVYGASKLAGELAVRSVNPRHVILRTAWVVSPHRTNFLKTMLRLATERSEVRVVHDQKGSPTSAADIAATLQSIVLRMIADPEAPAGTFHFVNAGVASWAEFAEYIFGYGALLDGRSTNVTRISTADYPTLAQRPKSSVLDTTKICSEYGISPRDWRTAIADIIHELVPRGAA